MKSKTVIASVIITLIYTAVSLFETGNVEYLNLLIVYILSNIMFDVALIRTEVLKYGE